MDGFPSPLKVITSFLWSRNALSESSWRWGSGSKWNRG